jgi:Spy/CpxP family protein refolding chaperone
MRKISPWLAMGLIFLAGLVSGAALTFGFRPYWEHPPGPKQMQSHWIAHLTERLNLTTDQQGKIAGILQDAGEQIRSLHHEEVDKISGIMAKADEQIAPLLTPDQQAEFKKMQEERLRDFSHHMRPWGPPPGGRPNMEFDPPQSPIHHEDGGPGP